jgi:hypothetical protein
MSALSKGSLIVDLSRTSECDTNHMCSNLIIELVIRIRIGTDRPLNPRLCLRGTSDCIESEENFFVPRASTVREPRNAKLTAVEEYSVDLQDSCIVPECRQIDRATDVLGPVGVAVDDLHHSLPIKRSAKGFIGDVYAVRGSLPAAKRRPVFQVIAEHCLDPAELQARSRSCTTGALHRRYECTLPKIDVFGAGPWIIRSKHSNVNCGRGDFIYCIGLQGTFTARCAPRKLAAGGGRRCQIGAGSSVPAPIWPAEKFHTVA